MKLATRLAVLAGAAAAFVVPVSARASATPISCWTEASLDKFGTTVVGTYYRDCTHYDEPQGLGLALEIKVCVGSTCGWTTLRSGVGNVTISCASDEFPMIRNSRLPGKIVSCP